jgi:hypothetical protein
MQAGFFVESLSDPDIVFKELATPSTGLSTGAKRRA